MLAATRLTNPAGRREASCTARGASTSTASTTPSAAKTPRGPGSPNHVDGARVGETTTITDPTSAIAQTEHDAAPPPGRAPVSAIAFHRAPAPSHGRRAASRSIDRTLLLEGGVAQLLILTPAANDEFSRRSHS